MPTFEGNLTPPPGRFALVAARFNQVVVENLIGGARDGFRRHGVKDDAVDLVWVPGSLEIPLIAKKLAESGKYAAVICLGAVIRGETDHYDHVAGGAAAGIARIGVETGVPVIFGILTCDTLEQALNRAGGGETTRVLTARLAAIEMVNLLHQAAVNRQNFHYFPPLFCEVLFVPLASRGGS